MNLLRFWVFRCKVSLPAYKQVQYASGESWWWKRKTRLFLCLREYSRKGKEAETCRVKSQPNLNQITTCLLFSNWCFSLILRLYTFIYFQEVCPMIFLKRYITLLTVALVSLLLLGG